jgi:hypothetical protein
VQELNKPMKVLLVGKEVYGANGGKKRPPPKRVKKARLTQSILDEMEGY